LHYIIHTNNKLLPRLAAKNYQHRAELISTMEQSDKSSNSFLRELKRRKVTKTCVLYIVLCWGVLQVGDIIYPAMGLDPDNASRIFLFLAVVGFPVTFAFAWFLQITPQGIVRTGSFVERRILNNIPPINERRRGDVTHYFRKGEARHEHHWIFTAETGPLAGLSFGIDRTVLLGRSLDCDLAIVSPQVSRNHAKLELDGEKLLIGDLGSSNGTVVNGKQVVGVQALRNDDEVRFHDIVFRVTESFSGSRSELEAMNQTTFINRADLPPTE
jgi:hypothetical protein